MQNELRVPTMKNGRANPKKYKELVALLDEKDPDEVLFFACGQVREADAVEKQGKKWATEGKKFVREHIKPGDAKYGIKIAKLPMKQWVDTDSMSEQEQKNYTKMKEAVERIQKEAQEKAEPLLHEIGNLESRYLVEEPDTEATPRVTIQKQED